MSTITWARAAAATTHRGPARALSVAGAAAAAAAVWAIAVPGLGINLVIRFGHGAPQTIQPGLVVGAALAASLCGWGLLAVLERRTHNARAVWTTGALVVTIASLSLPAVAAITAAAATALALMHVAVAAVLIPALRRSTTQQGATS
jgi:predicted permease